MEQNSKELEQAPVQQETGAEAREASVTSAAAPTPTEVPPAPTPTSEAASSVTDTQGLVRELASRLGEASGQIVVHRDLSALLDRMKDGVVVQLSIGRPRFFASWCASLKKPSRQVSICAGPTIPPSRPLGCFTAASMVFIEFSKAFSPAFSSQAYSTV